MYAEIWLRTTMSIGFAQDLHLNSLDLQDVRLSVCLAEWRTDAP